jgi:hypothetical protein
MFGICFSNAINHAQMLTGIFSSLNLSYLRNFMTAKITTKMDLVNIKVNE